MRVPVWLTLGVAILVCLFGAYRIRLAFRADEQQDDRAQTRRGFYRMARRTHLLIGVVYLLLGAALIATSFGWSPMGNMFGPSPTAPTKNTAPTKSGVPVDQLPQAK
jgi:protein-S-isoprenylcysteine O-methyltransferase Ste14